jgi:hypothetical protein
MEWDTLEPTADLAVRYCGICLKNVHLCRSEEELATAVVANLCVAIPANIVASYSAKHTSPLTAVAQYPRTLVGDVSTD